MKRNFFMLCVGLTLFSQAAVFADEVLMDWAYHDDDDEVDDRHLEKVPGEKFTFLNNNGTNEVSRSSNVVLYVLSPPTGDDGNIEVAVRWWNGETETWLPARQVKEITLGRDAPGGTFHGSPRRGQKKAILWLVKITPEDTRPGDNYYFFRVRLIKVDGRETVRYLTRSDPHHDNNLGQSWSPVSEVYGRDWLVRIIP